MAQLSERLLKDYAESGVIQRVIARRSDAGYYVIVHLTWRDEPMIVYTQRHHPRAWVSLDRLATYLQKLAPELGGFQVMF